MERHHLRCVTTAVYTRTCIQVATLFPPPMRCALWRTAPMRSTRIARNNFAAPLPLTRCKHPHECSRFRTSLRRSNFAYPATSHRSCHAGHRINGVSIFCLSRLLFRRRIATRFALRSPLRDNTPHTLTSSRARRYTRQHPNHPAPNSNRAPTRTPPTATSQSPRCPQQCASRHDLHTALDLPHARLHAHVMSSRTSLR